ncbi:MAG: hypothetical protein JSS66_06040 [Armatimonadetes bacterium]|nr:hypothetical protein [Armatimonadota bacterium]
MSTRLGHQFEGDIRRHIDLRLYDPTRNHDKVYHIILTELPGDKWNLYTLHGRRGSALRQEKKALGVTSWAVNSLHSKILSEKVNKGYIIQSDEHGTDYDENDVNYDDGYISLNDLDDEAIKVWPIEQFAKNPIRYKAAQSVKAEGYAAVVLPKGRRILTTVRGDKKTFTDEHGANLQVDEVFWQSILDLESTGENYVIDGWWDGKTYHVYDLVGEAPYPERMAALLDTIDGTTGDAVQMAEIYVDPQDVKNAEATARQEGCHRVLYIKLEGGGVHPGQHDDNFQVVEMKPRATLKVLSANGAYAQLGVDDGLGFIEVGAIAAADVKAGDLVEVEFESWGGHGAELTHPVFLKVVDGPRDCTIDQLLAV